MIDLLRAKKILVTHGTGFNWSEPDHFRLVALPDVGVLTEAIGRIWTTWPPCASRAAGQALHTGQMSRRVDRLTLDNLDDLVAPCTGCVPWQLDPVAADRAEAMSATSSAPGSARCCASGARAAASSTSTTARSATCSTPRPQHAPGRATGSPPRRCRPTRC